MNILLILFFYAVVLWNWLYKEFKNQKLREKFFYGVSIVCSLAILIYKTVAG